MISVKVQVTCNVLKEKKNDKVKETNNKTPNNGKANSEEIRSRSKRTLGA